MTVEAKFTSKSQFKGNFEPIANYNGYTILIDDEARKLIDMNEITIDQNGWQYYKRLIVDNAPLIKLDRKSSCLL